MASNQTMNEYLLPIPNHEALTRNFPKTPEFFQNRQIDDYLLACLAYRAKAEIKQEDQEISAPSYVKKNKIVLYIRMRDWTKISQMVIALYSAANGKSITPRRLIEHRNTLEKLGYLIEDRENNRWILQSYFDRFQILPGDVIWHLMLTGNKFVLKIYLYLLDGYDWKRRPLKEGDPPRTNAAPFTFTYKSILKDCLGYSGSHDDRNTALIKAVLYSLATQGLINFSKEYFYVNNHCDTDFVLNGVAHSMTDAADLQMSVEEVEELLHYAQKTPSMLSDKNVDARGQKRIPEQTPSPTDFTFLSDNISEKRRTTYTFLSDNTNENVLIHKRFCPTPPNSTNSITNCSRREQETASPSSLEEIERQRDMEAMAHMSSSIDGLDWDD